MRAATNRGTPHRPRWRRQNPAHDRCCNASHRCGGHGSTISMDAPPPPPPARTARAPDSGSADRRPGARSDVIPSARDPTIRTPVAPEAAFTMRTYATTAHQRPQLGAYIPAGHHQKHQLSAARRHSDQQGVARIMILTWPRLQGDYLRFAWLREPIAVIFRWSDCILRKNSAT